MLVERFISPYDINDTHIDINFRNLVQRMKNFHACVMLIVADLFMYDI